MQFTFNTGLQYSPAGQVIHVTVERTETVVDELIYEGVIRFHDETRGIRGHVDTFLYAFDSERDIQRSLMSAYDCNKYTLD